ncbi:MAG TPA: protein kinase [Gemmatimonadaceae bacterium]|nr:protein kinase [Gemmatimonadaceae bacterium]
MAPSFEQQLQASLGTAYTIEHELGGGGMSRVFVAEEARLRRKVVVKVLSPDLAAGISAERFEREIQLAASLQQANIVPVLSAGGSDGLPYYTMPLVEGESLRTRLARDGALPLADVVGILRDVARALAYAHERGVVHRDIKPDNVLLSGGAAVVTDFGIAKALSASRAAAQGTALTQMGTSIGTPAYMAPEQAAGDPDVDHRADIYALGCMAYELLTGETPFANRTPQRMLAAHLAEPPRNVAELRPDAPPALAELTMHCLAKEPAERPQSARDIVHTLDAVVSSDSLPALSSARRPLTLGRALAIYAAVFVLIAVLARAAVIAGGLPDWVFTGALVVAALGLPLVLIAGLSQRAAMRSAAGGQLTTPASAAGRSAVRTAAGYSGVHGASSSMRADEPGVPGGTLQRLAVRAAPVVTWDRVAKGGAGALGTFALAVGAIMVLRAFGVGPAASLVGEGKLADNDRVIVTDFRAQGADSSLGRIAAEALRTELGQSRTIVVVPTSAVAAALQRMQRPRDTTVDLSLARDIAIREGAKAVLDGEVRPLGNGYLVVVRLVAAESGNELAAFRETADGPSELIRTLDKLSRDVRERVGESLRTVRATPPLADVTTGSLEALRQYAAGVRAIDMEADYAKAITRLQRAVELDTAFAMAYRKLGVAYGNGGYESDKMDSALTRAFRFRDRLPERERLATIGTYYGNGPGADRQKGAAAYEALLEIDPDNQIALNNLGTIYISRRDLVNAERVYRHAISLPGAGSVAYDNLMRVLMSAGKLDAADSVARLEQERYPSLRTHAFDDVRILYARGKVDSARALLVRAQGSSDLITRIAAMNILADLDAVQGQLRDGIRLIEAAQAANAARGIPAVSWLRDYLMAQDDILLRGEGAQGVRRLDSLRASDAFARMPSDQRPYAAFSQLYAMAGRADRAREMLARFETQIKDSAGRAETEAAVHGLRGFIAIADGAPSEALREFRLSDTMPDGPSGPCGICVDVAMATAFDRAHQADSAIARYERYVQAPFYARSSHEIDGAWLAYVSRRLGELYEEKGDRARAAAYYQKFVTLWRNADPDLQPQVADVKRRLSRLKDVERG